MSKTYPYAKKRAELIHFKNPIICVRMKILMHFEDVFFVIGTKIQRPINGYNNEHIYENYPNQTPINGQIPQRNAQFKHKVIVNNTK